MTHLRNFARVLSILLPLLTAPAAAQHADPGKLPDTPAGKLVAEYVKAFNSGDEDAWRDFVTKHVAKSALEKVSVEERMKRYREVRSAVGGFEVRRVLDAGQSSIQVLAKAQSGRMVELSFELEPQPPHGLLGVRIESSEGDGGGERSAGPPPSPNNFPAPRVVLKENLPAKLDEYLTRMTSFGFSGAVLVAKDDRVLFNKAYGMADRAKGISNTPDTLFDTGSVAKQFTAAAVFKLEAMGKLSTVDSIGKYLDDVPPDKQAVTIDHLLQHKSGVVASQSFHIGDDFSDRDLRVRQILGAPLSFMPGERYEYSNAGYNLLAAIIEKVSGQSYQQFLYENLFKPAGMTSTIFHTDRFPVPGADKKTVARLYAGEQDNGLPRGQDNFTWFFTGPGGILTNPGDFFKWHRALLGDEVLPPAAKKKYDELAEAVGTMGNTPHGRLIAHGGGTTMGTGARIVRYLDAGVMIGVCINRSGEEFNDIITRGVTTLVFEGEVQMPPAVTTLAPASLRKFAGTYALASGSKLTASVAGGQLQLSAADAKGLETLFNTLPTERYRKLEQRTATIVEAYVKSIYEPLQRALISGPAPDRLAAREQRRWKDWEAKYGGFKGFTIVGTTPEPMDDAAVNVRFNFERGSVIAQYVWFPRGLDAVRVLADPPGMSFLPASETEFVSYNLATGAQLRVIFDLKGGDTVTGLTLHTGASAVTASRSDTTLHR